MGTLFQYISSCKIAQHAVLFIDDRSLGYLGVQFCTQNGTPKANKNDQLKKFFYELTNT